MTSRCKNCHQPIRYGLEVKGKWVHSIPDRDGDRLHTCRLHLRFRGMDEAADEVDVLSEATPDDSYIIDEVLKKYLQ
jgi:hypothetical protein